MSIYNRQSESVSATNDDAVITIVGEAGKATCVSSLSWSYNAAPTGGSLTVDDGTTLFAVDVTSAGPGFFVFTPPIKAAPGEDVVITLADGGADVVGKLNVVLWTE